MPTGTCGAREHSRGEVSGVTHELIGNLRDGKNSQELFDVVNKLRIGAERDALKKQRYVLASQNRIVR